MKIENINFTILGFGTSGQAAAELIHAYKGNVFISNNKPFDKKQMEIIKKFDYKYENNHSDKILKCDNIITSPGIDYNNEFIQKAIQKNIPVIPEIELAYNILNTKIIGITGTNGKSTITYLIYQILKSLNIETEFGGNISPGIPLSKIALDNSNTNKIIICELSSFQLEHIKNFKTYIGIISNISDDHLDRHKTFENYKKSKLNIFKNSTKNDIAILNYDDINLRDIRTKAKILNVSIKEQINGAYLYNNEIVIDNISINIENYKLIGEHNIINLMFALLAAYQIKPFDKNIEKIINNLKGLPHRMEYLGEIDNIKFYNNSMCTNPIAFYNSLKSITGDQTIIVGGRNKNFDLNIIIESIIKFSNNAVLIGESREMLQDLLKEKKYINVFTTETLEEAILKAIEITNPNSTINFSPGFASFDMFKNFIDRGNKFKQIFMDIKNG